MADISGVQGMQELLGKLGKLGSLVLSKNLIVRALRAGAEPIRERAAELAPIDPTQSEHPLREGMMTSVTDQTATGAIAKTGASRKGFYGQFPEFGTVNQAATPFLRPAFDEKIVEATRIVGETLAGGFEKEMKR